MPITTTVRRATFTSSSEPDLPSPRFSTFA